MPGPRVRVLFRAEAGDCLSELAIGLPSRCSTSCRSTRETTSREGSRGENEGGGVRHQTLYMVLQLGKIAWRPIGHHLHWQPYGYQRIAALGATVHGVDFVRASGDGNDFIEDGVWR